jgi:hypothetical protein
MSEPGWTLLLVLASILAVSVTALAVTAILALLDVRATTRTVRQTLLILTPKLDATLENVRQASQSVADGTAVFSQLGHALQPLASIGRKGSVVGAFFAGAAGLYSAFRRRRAAREIAAN